MTRRRPKRRYFPACRAMQWRPRRRVYKRTPTIVNQPVQAIPGGRRATELISNLRASLEQARANSNDISPARQFGYGLVELPGVRVFREIDGQGRLHVIDMISGDEIDGYTAIAVDADEVSFIFPEQEPLHLDTNGQVIVGRFADNGTLLKLKDGTQVDADTDFVSGTSATGDFVGTGCAYIYSRWAFQQGQFQGDPTIRVIARSRKVVDPRDITTEAVLTPVSATGLQGWAQRINGGPVPTAGGRGNRLLVITVHSEGINSVPTAASVGGQSMDLRVSAETNVADTQDSHGAIFTMGENKLISVDSDILTVTLSGTQNADNLQITSVLYENVDQADPIVDSDSSIGENNTTAPPLTLDTVERGIIVAMFGASGDFGGSVDFGAINVNWDGITPRIEVDTSSSTSGVAASATDGTQATVTPQPQAFIRRSVLLSISIRPSADELVGPFDSFDTLPKRFSVNPYLHVYDHLIRPKNQGGLGVPIDLVDSETFATLASRAEEAVTTQSSTAVAILTTTSNQTGFNRLLEFDQAITPFQYGDVVIVRGAAGSDLPSGLSADREYHVIPVRHAVGEDTLPAIMLADTLRDALEGNFITIGSRIADIEVTKTKETRYSSGLRYQAGDRILSRLLAGCGANMFLDDGKITVTSQEFPVESAIERVQQGDVLSEFAITPTIGQAEVATGLVGSFSSVKNLFLLKDYPLVDGGGVFVEQDTRETIRRFDLPSVSKPSVAQRLATIELRRRRQQRTITFTGSLSLFRLKPGKVFSIDFPEVSLDVNTTFEVQSQTVFVDFNDDIPFVGVEVVGRQLESTTFDLGLDAEAFVDDVEIPGLSSPFEVKAPTNLDVVESLFEAREGGGLKVRVTLSWIAPADQFVDGYLVSYRAQGADDFIFLPETPDLSARVDDITPGVYEFRVQAVNSVGRLSDPITATQNILGLKAPPDDPTGFIGQVVGNASVLLSWDLSTDLDVRQGGFVQIRHDPDLNGGQENRSILLRNSDGGQTGDFIPFKTGTYYIRFQDSTGNFSGFASWSTQARRPVGVAQDISGVDIPADGFTIEEGPSFTSSAPGNNMVNISGGIELPLQNTFDDVADVDAVANVDEVGGGGVVSEGVYQFSPGTGELQFTEPTRVILEAVLQMQLTNEADNFDLVDNVDNIADVDDVGASAVLAGLGDAFIEVRVSLDTIVSDTFGPWERLDTGVFNHRSYQFRLQVRSSDPDINVQIFQAGIRMRTFPE